jgi:peptidoglycan hydrolase-like protein with peptidoglycan-binding domain
MFDSKWINGIITAARQNGIDPAGLLAVVEVESAGNAFEQDGTTPRFLFERHVFYRVLQKFAPDRLRTAVAQGLAIPHAQSGQYSDQRTSAGKLALLARARAIDVDCADRACSWGLGQVLGENAESLGFGSVAAMMAALRTGGVAAQIDLMVRFIKTRELVRALNSGDWAGFARRYNGPNFRDHNYDSRLANAHAKWAQFMSTVGPNELPPEPAVSRGPFGRGDRGEGVLRMQARLKELGFLTGEVDGLYGPITGQAVAAFQRSKGLAETGQADLTTLQALMTPIASAGLPANTLAELIGLLLNPSAAPSTPPTAPAVPTLTLIDRIFGGEALAGKKTAIATIAYVILTILQSQGIVGTATGTPAAPMASAPAALLTSPAAAHPAAASKDHATKEHVTKEHANKEHTNKEHVTKEHVTAESTVSPAVFVTTAAPGGTKTPTGELLTTLILAFGGLGMLSKFDRIVQLAGAIAARPR